MAENKRTEESVDAWYDEQAAQQEADHEAIQELESVPASHHDPEEEPEMGDWRDLVSEKAHPVTPEDEWQQTGIPPHGLELPTTDKMRKMAYAEGYKDLDKNALDPAPDGPDFERWAEWNRRAEDGDQLAEHTVKRMRETGHMASAEQDRLFRETPPLVMPEKPDVFEEDVPFDTADKNSVEAAVESIAAEELHPKPTVGKGEDEDEDEYAKKKHASAKTNDAPAPTQGGGPGSFGSGAGAALREFGGAFHYASNAAVDGIKYVAPPMARWSGATANSLGRGVKKTASLTATGIGAGAVVSAKGAKWGWHRNKQMRESALSGRADKLMDRMDGYSGQIDRSLRNLEGSDYMRLADAHRQLSQKDNLTPFDRNRLDALGGQMKTELKNDPAARQEVKSINQAMRGASQDTRDAEQMAKRGIISKEDLSGRINPAMEGMQDKHKNSLKGMADGKGRDMHAKMQAVAEKIQAMIQNLIAMLTGSKNKQAMA